MANVAQGDPLDETREPLFPPVLPSWGGMLPAVPSAGYGDVSFDAPNATVEPCHDELTARDSEMLDRLTRILPSKPR